MSAIKDNGRVIEPLKDHDWSVRRRAEQERKGERLSSLIPRDGAVFDVASRASARFPGDLTRPYKRRRKRHRMFVGSKGFPEGVWVGFTEYLTMAENGPPWPEKSIPDISAEEMQHLACIARDGSPSKYMTWNERLEDAAEKKQLAADSTRYGDLADRAAQIGGLEKYVKDAIAKALRADREERKTEKTTKRLADDRAERTKRTTKAGERAAEEAASSGV